MAPFVLVIALTAFLAGVGAAVFIILVIGIRKGDRPERILENRHSLIDNCTRSVLHSGTWPNVPVYRDEREEG